MPGIAPSNTQDAEFVSLSLHPWYLSRENLTQQIAWIEHHIAQPKVVALGEAGIDKRCKTDLELQTSTFELMVQLSEKYKLPLIIHAVKSANEIIGLKKELRPQQPWIIHGFRGKTELMNMFISHGIYLSFGTKYNETSFKLAPDNMIFIETDDKDAHINELYAQGALLKEIPVEEFIAKIDRNVKQVFHLPR